jgi:hypothetical protein
MNWKDKIRKQISEASDSKVISKELKQLAKDLLEGDTEFVLIFLSNRFKYVSLRFVENIKTESKKIILKQYGLSTYKILNNEKITTRN